MQITFHDNYYWLEYKYTPWMHSNIKTHLTQRYFDFEKKIWKVPASNIKQLEVFAAKFKFTFVESEEAEQDYTINKLPELNIEIPLKRQLYPYQREGVAYGIEKKRIIIGDKPGLGKSGQGIAIVTALNSFPCLCITPNSPLKENWVDEWGLWTNKRAKVITPDVWRYMNKWIDNDVIQVFVIHYEGLKKYFVDSIDYKTDANGKKTFTLKDVKFNSKINLFKSVIIDEFHRCKEITSMRTKLVKGITTGKDVILGLTGTAVVNSNKDLIPQLGIIDRMNDLGGYKYYKSRFCAGLKEASNLKELNKRLTDTCFFSRNKEDVLTDLPDKIRTIVYCDLDDVHQREYDDAANDLEGYLVKYKEATDEQVQKSMKGEVMVRIGILKDISARGKLAQVREFIDSAIESEKLGLFMLQHPLFY